MFPLCNRLLRSKTRFSKATTDPSLTSTFPRLTRYNSNFKAFSTVTTFLHFNWIGDCLTHLIMFSSSSWVGRWTAAWSYGTLSPEAWWGSSAASRLLVEVAVIQCKYRLAGKNCYNFSNNMQYFRRVVLKNDMGTVSLELLSQITFVEYQSLCEISILNRLINTYRFMPGNNNLVVTLCRYSVYILNISTGKFTGATCSLIQVRTLTLCAT